MIPADATIWETLATYASFSYCSSGLSFGTGVCQNVQGSFEFAGAVPTFISGVDQVNLKILANLTTHPYSVAIWFFPDGPVPNEVGTGTTIWVK